MIAAMDKRDEPEGIVLTEAQLRSRRHRSIAIAPVGCQRLTLANRINGDERRIYSVLHEPVTCRFGSTAAQRNVVVIGSNIVRVADHADVAHNAV